MVSKIELLGLSQPIVDRLAPKTVINVEVLRSYSGVIDTDWSAAFRRAADRLAECPYGGAAWVPPGQDYWVSETTEFFSDGSYLTSDSQTRILRAGNFGPTFRWAGAAGTIDTPGQILKSAGVINILVIDTDQTMTPDKGQHFEFDFVNDIELFGVFCEEGAGLFGFYGATDVRASNFRASITVGDPTGRAIIRTDDTTVPHASVQWGGDMEFALFNLQGGAGGGLAAVDYLYDLRSGDGITMTGGHTIHAAKANVRLHNDGSQLSNVSIMGTFLDQVNGHGILADGPDYIDSCKFHVKLDNQNSGLAGKYGVLKTSPSRRSELVGRISGFKGGGVQWDTGVSIGDFLDVEIEDNSYEGVGLYDALIVGNMTRGTIRPRSIGGDGRVKKAIRVRADCTSLTITGGTVGHTSGGGHGLFFEPGFAGRAMVTGVDLKANPVPYEDTGKDPAAVINVSNCAGVGGVP